MYEQWRARRSTVVTKVGLVLAAVVVPAAALWTQQSDDALLHVDTFASAVGTVALFSLPGLALYLVLASRPVEIVGEGAAMVALFSAQWWASATDRHSTASLGPGFLGWLVIPCLIAAVWLVPRIRTAWESPSLTTASRTRMLAPATVVLVLLGPGGWIVAAWLWWRTFRIWRQSAVDTPSR